MALRRNAPDKVKLKLRGDGRPPGDLGNDLIQERPSEKSAAAEVRDRDGRAYLDWSGGHGAVAFGHADPLVAHKVIVAGLNALGRADQEAHTRLVALTHRLADGLNELVSEAPDGVSLEIRSAPGLVWLGFAPDPDGARLARFTQGMRDRGIWLPAGPELPWVVSLHHDLAAIDRTLMAAADSLGEAA